MIFMIHEKHGAMNVVSNADAVAAESNGWKRSSESEWLAEKIKPQAEESTEAPKKRGRRAKAE